MRMPIKQKQKEKNKNKQEGRKKVAKLRSEKVDCHKINLQNRTTNEHEKVSVLKVSLKTKGTRPVSILL